MIREAMAVAESLKEQLGELEEFLAKLDDQHQAARIRERWTAFGHAIGIQIKDASSNLGTQLKSLVHSLKDELQRSRPVSPLELLKDLAVMFLKGPMAVVARDFATEQAQAAVKRKAERGQRLDTVDLQALRLGLENLNGSSLYDSGYRFIYAALDKWSQGLDIHKPDDLAIYPPNDELFEIALPMVVLYSECAPILELIEEGLKNADRLDNAGFQSRLHTALEDSEPFRQFRALSRDLTKTVIGSAATDFLIKAVETIPEVEPYLKATMARVEHDRTAGDREYPKMLAEAPAYVRVLCYVSEANEETHRIDGAEVPFPPSTSQSTSEDFDAMITRLFGDKASLHPFYSATRHSYFSSHPLDVQTRYLAWRQTDRSG